MKKSIYLVLAFVLAFQSATSWGCSAFSSGIGANPLVAKSYDWALKPGIVFLNKRNVGKAAMYLNPQPNPFRWVSKYGSVTFNQYGRELPNGGVNERGLMIEILWLDSSQYPAPDARPGLNEGQWAQYALDNFATVEEMAANMDQVRLSPIFGLVHHLVCDRSGACAVFENIGGQLVVSRGEGVSAITNSTYADSADYLKGFEGFGGTKSIPMVGYDSRDRFVRIAHLQKQFTDKSTQVEQVNHAFEMLKAVRKVGYSGWNIVYDYTRSSVFFKYLPTGEGIREIDLRGLDFSCRTPVQAFDMTSSEANFAWHDYSYAENLALIRQAVEHHKNQLPNPETIAERVAKYPDMTKCMEP